MVPPGIPGRSDADFLPKYDPADAPATSWPRPAIPGGAGFPTTVLMTGGSGFDEAIVAELKRELGITLQAETMGDGYFDRLAQRPAGDVVAGVGRRLSRAATTSSASCSAPAPRTTTATGARPTFDAAIAEADARRPIRPTASAAYDRAEAIVRDEVPVVPLVVRAGLGAVADRAARRRPERPRHRAHGGAGVGGLMRRRPARRCSCAGRSLLLAVGLSLGRVAAARRSA